MSDARYDELARVAGPVSRETFSRLIAFQATFEKWAARINLAAPSTIPELWNRHILDSAQLVPLAPNALRFVDLGSGGGFPGAVLAVLLADRDGASITLVESNQKKVSFLRNAIAGSPGRVVAKRIEEFAGTGEDADIVTARALAPLNKLLGLAEPWLSAGATALFHKGRDYRREIEESRDAWQFSLVEHPSVIDAASVILEISDLKKR
ncbi:16S rRNA (guanine(527)-N(7))-methyltransferase RsmG [Mesorhizobium sp. Z1-4]|uniref:16S rRNA (guanine(527)-N(7))-methyltransferase RsmG n=1 Tax=Mesorhizobium sp. Z1-4 TaxID=2448478 RepID=UPI000FDCD327|nr:16S rRNA (guanine(527)-N(7))-methyltransferase RsmG [Mesorhizobium sp. Z1-4]